MRSHGGGGGGGGSMLTMLSRRCRPRHIYSASLLLLVLCVALLFINVYELRTIQADHAALHASQPPPPPPPAVPSADVLRPRVGRPIVWVYGKKVSIEFSLRLLLIPVVSKFLAAYEDLGCFNSYLEMF